QSWSEGATVRPELEREIWRPACAPGLSTSEEILMRLLPTATSSLFGMRRTAITKLALMALLALAVAAKGVAHPAGAGTLYTLKDLGTLPGGVNSFGFAVNDAGQVAGYSTTAGGTSHGSRICWGVMLRSGIGSVSPKWLRML